MKKQLILIVALIAVMTIGTTSAFANDGSTDYGAEGASHQTSYTMEDMLLYAIQDEYLALAEYNYLIEELGADRPFTNIVGAEQNHIEAIELLYTTHGIEIPTIDPSSLLYLPTSIEEALSIGVQAEIDNIAMYETFLNQDLPEDVRISFENLQSASESHLAAFENNTQNGGRNNNQGKTQDNGQGNGIGRGRNNNK